MYSRYSILITLLLVYSLCGYVHAFNGPHNLSESPCSVCHIPHHAADDLLWARDSSGEFEGVKKLCATCHGTGAYGAKDRFGIFSSSQSDSTFDHVMGVDASIIGESVKRRDWSQFPLREKEGGDGFYCGSCHNPHQDPYEPNGGGGGGDYLREEVMGTLDNPTTKLSQFCSQCHEDLVNGDAYGHGSNEACFDCHHPHNSPNPGSKIIITLNQSFKAIPNVPGFLDDESAASCYGCHKAGGGGPGSINAPIAGDDCGQPYEHHPMGVGADISISGHQKTAAGPLNESNELLCRSCHAVHNGTNDRYLNNSIINSYDPKNSGLFCIACHSDKDILSLGKRGTNHHQEEPPNNQCLFCHSIHMCQNDPAIMYQTDEDRATEENSSVSVDVIMRVPPINLKWADKNLDFDNRDYEDACYGCHSNPDLVGPKSSLRTLTDSDVDLNKVKTKELFDTDLDEDALLLDNVEDGYFSHRFDAEASDAIKELKPFDDHLPVVSDGKEKGILDDYNVEKDHIWCGSCHNVHKQGEYFSYYTEYFIKERTAYLREENISSALCKKCHFDYGGHPSNHPMDRGPNDTLPHFPTNKSFPELFYSGRSGGIGGQTSDDTGYGEIICQTCHSVHTAVTNWNGYNRNNRPQSGYLLVITNNYTQGQGQGSGLCLSCHMSQASL
ncbi:MAG: hypothetical protein ACMUJM_00595 [bacterium]